jgi:hypothetical protein
VEESSVEFAADQKTAIIVPAEGGAMVCTVAGVGLQISGRVCQLDNPLN